MWTTGKSAILDAIRQPNVMEGEAGGITQNIRRIPGCVEKVIENNLFSTTGHEAFTAMRAAVRR
jgi:translation initiation factor IF-2